MSGAAWLGLPLLRAEPHAAVSRRAVRVRASPRSLPRAFSSCCPASYVLGSAALQRQAGCPDPAPRSELDPCFWGAVPDASGANGRLRRAESTRVTRTLEFGRVLSRDDDRSDEELTNILCSHVPEQMPEHMEIVPLPKEIVSWLTSLLQRLPPKTQSQEKHKRTKLRRGNDGSPGASPSGSKRTASSSMNSPEEKESDSWEPLPWLFVKDDFQDHLSKPWLKAQSEVPFHLWLRPSEKMTIPTPQKTRMVNLADFYRGYSDRSKKGTQTQSNKKHCPLQC